MEKEPLLKHFENFMPFSEDEKKNLHEKFELIRFKKKEKILIYGKVCKHYYFIVEGCFRMFGVDDKGFEHNIQFAAENDWISDIGSFYTQKASHLNIEALENSLVLRINKEDLFYLFKKVRKINMIFKVLIEGKYIEMQNRVLQSFSSSAEDRYLSFLEQYPILSKRIPNIQIASYLGITPEFLSKIRKNLRRLA